MKNNLSSLLRKIFLGSLAGIAVSNMNATSNSILVTTSSDDENKVESLLKETIDLTPKLLLKKNNSNEWFAMAHRSHRSHSSHRSHYSSSSGGTYTPPTPSNSTNSTNSSNSSNSTNSTNSTNSSNSGLSLGSNIETPTTALKLGSRTLKKGMSGTDVTELVNILLRKQYLKLDNGGTQVTGIYEFDKIVEDAVKVFQKDNGLPSDGVCGSTTIYYLKNK